MSDLQNQTPADTYKGLLQVGDYTNGVDGNSEYVQDGEGTNSALSISTTKVGVGTVSPSAELDVNGSATVSGDMKVGGLLYNESISSTFQQNQTISVTAPSISEGSVYHVSATRHTGSSSSQLRVAYVHYTNNGTAVLSDSISNSNVNLTASGSTISVTNNSTSATLKLRVLRVG